MPASRAITCIESPRHSVRRSIAPVRPLYRSPQAREMSAGAITCRLYLRYGLIAESELHRKVLLTLFKAGDVAERSHHLPVPSAQHQVCRNCDNHSSSEVPGFLHEPYLARDRKGSDQRKKSKKLQHGERQVWLIVC